MKAMLIRDFGGPDVFYAGEVERPQPGPHDVLVKVYATSVNPVDYKIRQAGASIGIKPPTVIGYDVSGVVEEIGAEVRDFKVGDEVYYTPEIPGILGSYAEYHIANEAIVSRKPANLSHTEAASLPLAGGTAWDALITRTKLQPGETVLIHGGTGGVGSLAIQIAKAAGAYVYTTCSGSNADFARKLGADRVIDYKTEDFVEIIQKETQSVGVDVAFDAFGGDLFSRSIQVVKPHGRIVGIVSTTGDLNGAFYKNITIHFLFLQRARYKLDALRNLIERGLVKPVVDSVMPITQIADAHSRLEHGGVKGKIVLDVIHTTW